MFSTLFSKTFLVLGVQQLVALAGAAIVMVRSRAFLGKPTPAASKKDKKAPPEPEIQWRLVRPYFWLMLAVSLALLPMLYVSRLSIYLGLAVLAAWSVAVGAWVGLGLVRGEKFLAFRAIGIVATATLVAAVVGTYPGISATAQGAVGFFAALVLIAGVALWQFVRLRDRGRRIAMLVALVVLEGYFLLSYEHVSHANKAAENTWPVAMQFAINVYQDVLNLVIGFFELLGQSGSEPVL